MAIDSKGMQSLWFSTTGTQQPGFQGQSAKVQPKPGLHHTWAHRERLSPNLFQGLDLCLGDLGG